MKNPKKSFTLFISTLMIAAFFGCDDDNGSPKISDDSIHASNSTGTSIRLTWTAANDEQTPASKLLYRVILSKSNNISDVSAAEDHTIDADLTFQEAITTKVVDVVLGTKYFATVIVKDEDGNKSIYNVVSFTATDKTGPEIENSSLLLTNVDIDRVDVSWTPLTDVAVKYKVVYSASDNVSTVGDAETNGTVSMDYTAGVSTTTVNGLDVATNYYFNVIAKDSAGNKSAYSSSGTQTLCFIAGTMISMADGSKKAIEDVKVGDSVKSFDEKGNMATSMVEKIISKDSNDLITLAAGDATITGTSKHPFFTGSKERQNKKYPGFRNLGKFAKGDMLKMEGGNDLSTATVSSVEKHKDRKEKVYNVHMGQGPATFFANGFAVHNK